MLNQLGRTALVTGAARGIGLECAHRLRADGYRVIAVDLSPDGATSTPEGAHEYHSVDVSDSAAVRELAANVGAVDVLVNSAGVVGPNLPTVEVSDEDWQRTLAVNLNGTFYLSRAFAPGMIERGWGRIVNIASIAGKEGNPNLAAYSASKAAVIAFTKSLGKELATTGVLVNSIAPAVIATPMNEETAPHVLEYMISKIPMGRTGTSAEVAALVAWLASEECSFSTGACYDISGGRATY
ncbi:MAG TPA: SDR family NAD(P)-dependent oxidoreductase [Ilumatobacteraceae bacterium]|nr:SDR family NAD(P)-dependent oxidoreductase [Ilumatobacteraceae bacterium]